MRDYAELVNSLKNCVNIPCNEAHKEKCLAGRESDCRRELMAIAADVIEELSKHRWIPVTERLPEEAGSYLVTVHQDYIENAEGYSLVLDAWYNPKTYPFTTVGWTLLNEWYDLSPRLKEEITHWMPLPEPPKEDGNA